MPDMGLVKLTAKSVRRLPAMTVAAGAGWLVYSAAFVDHRLALPPSLEGREEGGHHPALGRIVSYHRDAADGSAAPVALVHGVGVAATAREGRPIFDGVDEGRAVAAVDLPGFGRSDRLPIEYTAGHMTDGVVELLRRLDGPAHVVAVSQSCEFAAAAALARPDLVRTLTLISPTGFGRRRIEEPPPTEGTLGAATRVPLIAQAFFDLLTTRPAIRWQLERRLIGPADEDLVDHSYAAAHQPNARFAPLSLIRGDLSTPGVMEGTYGVVTSPVLVIHDRDPHTGFDELAAFVVDRPNWSVERIVPSAGLPHFEQPERTLQALATFWERVEADGGNGAED